MYDLRHENPAFSSSHEFIGSAQGDTGVSVFPFHEAGFGTWCATASLMARSSSSRKAGGWAVTGKSFEHSDRAMAQ